MGKEELKEKKAVTTADVSGQPFPSSTTYVAIYGLNYGCSQEQPNGTRVEAGEEVPLIAVTASPWLLTNGHIKPKKDGGDVSHV